ncbi:uncharacterized protein [Ptychodera flava]|uniref:uncharacterized protein n=1 Tax=Ptychodera flava TaxID=63121 RepID=UPI00396A9FC2
METKSSTSRDGSERSSVDRIPTFGEFAAEMMGNAEPMSATMTEIAKELYEMRLESLRAMRDIDPKEDKFGKKRKKRRRRSLSADDYVRYSIDKSLPRPVRKFLVRLQKNLNEPECSDKAAEKCPPNNVPLHLMLPSSPRQLLHTPAVELLTEQKIECTDNALSDEFNPTLTPVFRQFPNTTFPHAGGSKVQKFASAESLTTAGTGSNEKLPTPDESPRVFDIFTEVQMIRSRSNSNSFKASGSPPTPRSTKGGDSPFSSPRLERHKTKLGISLSFPSQSSLLERRCRENAEEKSQDSVSGDPKTTPLLGRTQSMKSLTDLSTKKRFGLLPPLVGIRQATKSSRADIDAPTTIPKQSAVD